MQQPSYHRPPTLKLATAQPSFPSSSSSRTSTAPGTSRISLATGSRPALASSSGVGKIRTAGTSSATASSNGGLPSKYQGTASSASASSSSAATRPSAFARPPTSLLSASAAASQKHLNAAIGGGGGGGVAAVMARAASDIGAYDGGFERDNAVAVAVVRGEAAEMLSMDSSSVDK